MPSLVSFGQAIFFRAETMIAIVLFIILVGVSCPIASWADTVIPFDASIENVKQQSQTGCVYITANFDNVEVTKLIRADNDGTEEVVIDHELSMSDAYGHFHFCDGPNASYCQDNPDNCTDCDEDGTIECPNKYCYTYYDIVIADLCIPPGNGTYTLVYIDHYGEDTDSHHYEATDSGADCASQTPTLCGDKVVPQDSTEPPDDDDSTIDDDASSDDDLGPDDDGTADDDATSDDDTSADDDLTPDDDQFTADDDADEPHSQCGCRITNSRESPWLVTGLMLALGLAFLKIGRKKS